MNDPRPTQTQLFELPEPTLDDLVKCVEREIGYRNGVYPRRVQAGKMKQEKADQEIHMMRKILRILRDMG